jgi:hypothetical protein
LEGIKNTSIQTSDKIESLQLSWINQIHCVNERCLPLLLVLQDQLEMVAVLAQTPFGLPVLVDATQALYD